MQQLCQFSTSVKMMVSDLSVTDLESQSRADSPVHLGHVEVGLGQVVDADEPVKFGPKRNNCRRSSLRETFALFGD